MERLKAILADKILDLSIGSGDEVKAKVDKMQRFRDFANACQTLMIKYPSIEDELIKMVKDGDFDTKVASSRVDSVIRLADIEAAAKGDKIANQLTESADILIAEEGDMSNLSITEEPISNSVDVDNIPIEMLEGDEEVIYHPEDIDYEEVESTDEDADRGYVSYENVDTTTEANSQVGITEEYIPNEEELAAAKRKTTIRRVIQIVGVVLAVIALIFIIKFVMTHWQIILIIIGAAAVLAGLFVWFFKRKQN